MDQKFPERISLEVSQCHLDTGSKGKCRTCPVALSFEDYLRSLSIKFDYVEVYRNVIGVFRFIASTQIIATYKPETPEEKYKAMKFIHTFDSSRCDDPKPATINYRLVPA